MITCIAGNDHCYGKVKAICKISCDQKGWLHAYNERNKEYARDLRLLKHKLPKMYDKMYAPIDNAVECVLDFVRYPIAEGMENSEVVELFKDFPLPVMGYLEIGELAEMAYRQADKEGRTTKEQQTYVERNINQHYIPHTRTLKRLLGGAHA